jgi:hypothetical protein
MGRRGDGDFIQEFKTESIERGVYSPNEKSKVEKYSKNKIGKC